MRTNSPDVRGTDIFTTSCLFLTLRLKKQPPFSIGAILNDLTTAHTLESDHVR